MAKQKLAKQKLPRGYSLVRSCAQRSAKLYIVRILTCHGYLTERVGPDGELLVLGFVCKYTYH